MAGSKTRFGFTGDGSEPPDSDEARSARTIIGHDAHLRLPPGFALPKPPPPPPPSPPSPPVFPPPPQGAQVAAPMPEEITESIPGRRPRRLHTSRLARFLGRWTESGRFESRRSLGDSRDDGLEIPRETTGRNVVLVVAVALLTFLLAFAVTKIRQHFAHPGPPATEPSSAAPALPAPSPAPAPPPAAAPVPTPPATPVPVPASRSAPAPVPPPPAPPPASVASPPSRTPAGAAAKPAASAHKSSSRSAPLAAPPLHLSDQLMPISR